MRTKSLLLILLLLSSCALKVDQAEARKVAEDLLNDLKARDYSRLDSYYSALSNESEPHDQKVARYQQLEEATGAVKSYEFLSAKETYESVKGLNQLELKYKVVCEKVTVLQTFLFINDEGDSKIIFQNIENIK